MIPQVPRFLARILLAAFALAATAVVGLSSPASAYSSGWTSFSAGSDHTCGIRGGRVYCWGSRGSGRLGSDPGIWNFEGDVDSPQPINSKATDWKSVSAGGSHTCAIRAGRIACWGDDTYGQLGDGTAGGSRIYPVGIKSSATDWTSVSAGAAHTCGTRAGRVYCWGNDGSGQLGDGTPGGIRATPVVIKSGVSDWKSVSAGGSHTCAGRAYRVYCWGGDSSGQLGDGTEGSSRPYPALIQSSATDWLSVSAGRDHTCATRTGRIACWGSDVYGKLGRGSASGSPATPSLIDSTATDWKQVSAGTTHSCATRAGRVYCWGYDFRGQLGDGSGADEYRSTPDLIASGATDWRWVDAGGEHTCATRASASYLACWGNDDAGQLGDGSGNPAGPYDPMPDPYPGLVG